MGGSSYAIKPYQETCSTGLATARGVTVNQVAFLGYIIIILGEKIMLDYLKKTANMTYM